MTDSQAKDEARIMTEKILNFTLEIIYLLTGESFTPVNSGDDMTITVPPCDSLKLEKHNMQKILEVTRKIIKMLLRESGNPRNYNIFLKEEYKEQDEEYGAMEEFSERHKDVTMEPPNNRNPPEKWDSCIVPPHDHKGDLNNCNNIVKEEVKEEYNEDGVMEACSEEQKNPCIMMEPSSTRNPPEGCPRPLNSQDCAQEDHNDTHHNQGEDLIDIKVEIKAEEEETLVGDNQQSMKEDGIMGTFIEDDTPTEISTVQEWGMRKISEDCLILSPGCKSEDEDITQYCLGEKPASPNVHLEEPQNVKDSGLLQTDKRFSCTGGNEPKRSHMGKRLYFCPECEKFFISKSHLDGHQSCHTGEKPYFCLECGKCFLDKSSLTKHQNSHVGEKPYFCPECGEGFLWKSQLLRHQRNHKRKMPYFCAECEKCYQSKTEFFTHQRSHKGEKPHSCPECGKCFSRKAHLSQHQIGHTGEKPYSCPECGKGFSRKAHLSQHQICHTGEKPYSCPECGKCYVQKSTLLIHQKYHAAEKPYSCPECGKCFVLKPDLDKHLRTHTGEKPYSCSECGKCFSQRGNLLKHQNSHTNS